jgi:hypothetical protein
MRERKVLGWAVVPKYGEPFIENRIWHPTREKAEAEFARLRYPYYWKIDPVYEQY